MIAYAGIWLAPASLAYASICYLWLAHVTISLHMPAVLAYASTCMHILLAYVTTLGNTQTT